MARLDPAVALARQIEAGFDALREANGQKGLVQYIEASLIRDLEAFHAAAPGAIATPNGRLILTQLFAREPSLGLAWWRLKGPDAWRATTVEPYPLKQVLGSLVKGVYNPDRPRPGPRFQWGPRVTAKEAWAFLADGMAHAMPLGTPTPAVHPETLARALDAQARVTTFCTEGCSLFTADAKARLLRDHGGQLALEPGEQPFGRMAALPALSPTDPIWTPTAGNRGWNLPVPLASAWGAKVPLQHADAVRPWLARHGVDATPFEHAHLRHALDTAATWEEAKAALAAAPDGWAVTAPHTGRLAWQAQLARAPAFLEALLESPEARPHLAQTGPSGEGLWAPLLEGLFAPPGPNGVRPAHPGAGAVRILHATVPPPAFAVPLLFRTPDALPIWWEGTAKAMAPQHPDAWLGAPDPAQAEAATALLRRMLVNQGTGNPEQRKVAVSQIRPIHELWKRHPGLFHPGTVGVLRSIQHMVAQHVPALRLDLAALLEERFPPPSAEDMGWVDHLERQLPTGKPHATRTLLLGMVRQGQLLRLPEAPAAVPRRPRL